MLCMYRSAQLAVKRVSLPSNNLSFSGALGGGSGLEDVTVSNGGRVVMMRHQKGVPKLGLPSDQRKALIRSLTTELLRHGRIKTTKVRTKELNETLYI